MKFLIAIVTALALVNAAESQIKIAPETTIKVGRLARIEAIAETPIRWINLADDLDLIPDSSGRFAFIQAVKPGRFKIAVYTASKDGIPSEPTYVVIIVEGPPAPMPPKPPSPTPPSNVEASIVKLRFGNSGCTATIIGPRRADGKWDILTAAHCTAGQGSRGTITLNDGKQIGVTVAVRDTRADISWMIADTDAVDLPHALLSRTEPDIGANVWHKGYGVDVPGNKEVGTVAAKGDSNGQLRFSLSVSSGDSGSGIFRSDTNEVCAVVCCTSSMARKGAMWGGSSTTAWKLRPSNTSDEQIFDGVIPVPIPQREIEDRIMPLITFVDLPYRHE